ncbi:MAG: GlsB/YeaQ/YmgE family stress response membrane protein [Rikenella sp.]|nr:GlsB/YeaQ/YmgE family stress response membrane protein [Rikenella sp.]
MYVLWFILIGLAAGWLGSLIMKGRGSGLIMNLVIGVVGGLLGGWIFSWFGWEPSSRFGSLITALVGSIVLLWIASLIRGRKKA